MEDLNAEVAPVMKFITLEEIHRQAGYTIPERNLDFRFIQDHETGYIVATMVNHIYSTEERDRVKLVTFKKPAGVFQHFKERWFPQLLLKFFPVKYIQEVEKVKFTARALFPELEVVGERYSIYHMGEFV